MGSPEGSTEKLWSIFVALGREHATGLCAAAVFLVILLAVRTVLDERRRSRFTLAMFALYALSFPVRALLLRLGADGPSLHSALAVSSDIALALAVVAVSALLLFDYLGAKLRLPRIHILRDIISTAAAVIAIFTVLSRASVNVLSLVTTSAVLTAVIGLAFQDTLGNILAGLTLQLEQTIAIGDWVQVGEITGKVSEVHWRSTELITRNDDLVVIPNAMLAKGIFTNLSRPVPWHRQWVHFSVHYRHPPNEVQRIVLDAMRDLPNVKPSDPGPDCIYYRMEQDHAHYALRYRLLDLARDDGTDSEVKKRLWYAFRRHKIEIPYPSRNLFITELTQEREQGKLARELGRRVESLRKIDLFSPLDDGQRAQLAERLSVEIYGVGEEILSQGAPGDSMYFVSRGEVAIRVSVEGLARDVATLGPGQIFGEMSLMTGEKRRATVIARGDVECYVIDRRLFQEVLEGKESVVSDISRILAARLAQLEGDVKDLSVEAASRLATERHADLFARISRFLGLRR